MIKTWYTFNENNDNLRGILSEKLSEVREPFYELEDLDIISYGIIASGDERSGLISFNPKASNRMSDIDLYLDYITPVVKLRTKFDSSSICVVVDIKLPGESSEFGSTVIGNKGIELFDDIISGVNRLKDLGYDVKLDFNASHGQYKPLKILAYFNI
jgi:predicted nucleotidyltransferase